MFGITNKKTQRKVDLVVDVVNDLKRENKQLKKRLRGIENNVLLKKYKKLIDENVNLEKDYPEENISSYDLYFRINILSGELIDVYLDSDNYIVATIKGSKSTIVKSITKTK